MKQELKVAWWDIEKVIPYEDNPRINDAAVERVAESIRKFGWQQPIVIDSEGIVIVGHTRLKAGRLIEARTVPVHVANLSPEAARAYRIADNKTGDIAEWDWQKLAAELKTLEAVDPEWSKSTGFSEAEIANLMAAEWRPPAITDLPARAGGEHQVHFSSDQWLIIEQAVAIARKAADGTISQARALELICADYIAGQRE